MYLIPACDQSATIRLRHSRPPKVYLIPACDQSATRVIVDSARIRVYLIPACDQSATRGQAERIGTAVYLIPACDQSATSAGSGANCRPSVSDSRLRPIRNCCFPVPIDGTSVSDSRLRPIRNGARWSRMRESVYLIPACDQSATSSGYWTDCRLVYLIPACDQSAT